MTDSTENVERKKPGRPPRERSAASLDGLSAARAGVDLSDGRDPNQAVKRERQRIPLGKGQDLWFRGYQFDKENYHYYVFHEDNTRGGRIAEADQAFYEHCTINGENIKRPSGNGWDYLMRLPMKYYIEDQLDQRRQREALEHKMNSLSNKDGIQEYAIDKHGRATTDGEALAMHKTSDNPYA